MGIPNLILACLSEDFPGISLCRPISFFAPTCAVKTRRGTILRSMVDQKCESTFFFSSFHHALDLGGTPAASSGTLNHIKWRHALV